MKKPTPTRATAVVVTIVLAILHGTGFAVQTRPNPSSRSRAQSITGRVLDEAGQPLRGVSVQLMGLDSLTFQARFTTTDDSGRFAIDGLRAGAYMVGANEAGMVPSEETLPRRYYRPGDSVTIRLTSGGVITGTVSDASGQPVVAISVKAFRVRDGEGRTVRTLSQFNRRTDDRGVYRLYGLLAGTYVVLAGGAENMATPTAYEENAPTYYPSGTRDTASEVTVRTGEEARGIDIRYRGERGHAITGSVSAARGSGAPAPSSIQLISAASGKVESSTFVGLYQQSGAFGFFGVPDGEYFLVASASGQGESAASGPTRVTVKKANVTGVELSLVPLASIAGRVQVEPRSTPEKDVACKNLNKARIEEMVISARRYDQREETSFPWLSNTSAAAAPSERGDFTIRSLRAGRYRLGVRLLNDTQYVRSISLPSVGAAKPKNAAVEGFALTEGERVNNVTITIAEGASALSGRVEDQRFPDGLRVHLAPAEVESAGDVLRYYEAVVTTDGAFTLTNLAPGRYSVVTLTSPVEPRAVDLPRQVAWEAAGLARIRRLASQSKIEVNLKACEHLKEFGIRYQREVSETRNK